LSAAGSGWTLDGTVSVSYDGTPCALRYEVELDERWRTRRARVAGWFGAREIAVRVETEGDGRWLLNGAEQHAVAGCLDIDFAFSPVTNLLPIRRLAPAIGSSVPVQAAWLRFPSLTLELLEQQYTRVDELSYAYESAGGAFTAELTVDEIGFVVHYATGDRTLWRAEP
jgi:hypothetical protein